MEKTEWWRYEKHIMIEVWKTQNSGDMEKKGEDGKRRRQLATPLKVTVAS